MNAAVLAIVIGLLGQGLGAAGSQEALSAAQKLYLAAQFDEAVKVLDGLKAGAGLAAEGAVRVEQMRALCLLALDRRADAQRAIEAILEIDPFFQPGEDDAAPKIRAAFRDVRRRVLPAVLGQLYARAKQAYDRQAYSDAEAGFRRVSALLDDDDLTLDQAAKAGMRIVATAFADLSDAAAAPPPAPVAPTNPAPAAADPAPPAANTSPATANSAASTPTPAPPAALPAPGALGPSPVVVPPVPGRPSWSSVKSAPGAAAGEPIYDAHSPDIIPPVVIQSAVSIPDAARPIGSPREVVVEIVVAPTGAVESAAVRQSAGSVYDAFVLSAVSGWRYRPATRNGLRVRFRLIARVVVPTHSIAAQQ